MTTFNRYCNLRKCFETLKWSCDTVRRGRSLEDLQNDQSYIKLLNIATKVQIAVYATLKEMRSESKNYSQNSGVIG